MSDALYPLISPFETGMLDVGDGQQLYYEWCGNPAGKPVVFLHGGPGAGIVPDHRRLFDPAAYRILLFDQRGCGRSTPSVAAGASLAANTTAALLADIETFREAFGIDRWQVFGGSWGSTLALAYAEAHPERVAELIVRGIFLFRQFETDWLYNGTGTRSLFPDLWEAFEAPIPVEERGRDHVVVYHRLLHDPDPEVALRAARAWTAFESQTITLRPPASLDADLESAHALAIARIENHYFVNHGFLEEDQLIQRADRLSGIPGTIVQGRYDAICPVRSAWDLHRAWPEAELVINDAAGHAVFEPQNAAALVAATDRYAARR
jgi:proline iminopeptidase